MITAYPAARLTVYRFPPGGAIGEKTTEYSPIEVPLANLNRREQSIPNRRIVVAPRSSRPEQNPPTRSSRGRRRRLPTKGAISAVIVLPRPLYLRTHQNQIHVPGLKVIPMLGTLRDGAFIALPPTLPSLSAKISRLESAICSLHCPVMLGTYGGRRVWGKG